MLRAIRMCLQPIVANGYNTPRLLVFLGCASGTTFTSGIIAFWIIRPQPGIISQIEIKYFYCNRHVEKEKANMMMSESRCVLLIQQKNISLQLWYSLYLQTISNSYESLLFAQKKSNSLLLTIILAVRSLCYSNTSSSQYPCSSSPGM